MAADLSGGGSPEPVWWHYLVAAGGLLGGGNLITRLIDHFSGRRRSDAEAQKAQAETRTIEAETANVAGHADAEFEQARTDLLRASNETWRDVVDRLQKLVEGLQAQNRAQNERIAALEKEVTELRKALDDSRAGIGRASRAERLAADKALAPARVPGDPDL